MKTFSFTVSRRTATSEGITALYSCDVLIHDGVIVLKYFDNVTKSKQHNDYAKA